MPRPSQLKPCTAAPALDTLTVKAVSNAHTDTSITKHIGKFVETLFMFQSVTESDNIPQSSLLKPNATAIPIDALM